MPHARAGDPSPLSCRSEGRGTIGRVGGVRGLHRRPERRIVAHAVVEAADPSLGLDLRDRSHRVGTGEPVGRRERCARGVDRRVADHERMAPVQRATTVNGRGGLAPELVRTASRSAARSSRCAVGHRRRSMGSCSQGAQRPDGRDGRLRSRACATRRSPRSRRSSCACGGSLPATSPPSTPTAPTPRWRGSSRGATTPSSRRSGSSRRCPATNPGVPGEPFQFAVAGAHDDVLVGDCMLALDAGDPPRTPRSATRCRPRIKARGTRSRRCGRCSPTRSTATRSRSCAR